MISDYKKFDNKFGFLSCIKIEEFVDYIQYNVDSERICA